MKKEIDYEGFKSELDKLTKKYHIEILGCGCCGSPRLEYCKPRNDSYYINGRDNLMLQFKNGK